jgi:hypothetical protein
VAKSRVKTTEKSIKDRLDEGRGQGTGANYTPWLTIHDVPSLGEVHRIRGIKTHRVHHLMSRLEAYYFYILERSEAAIDIREQYPLLPQEDTLKLARRCGVRHPMDPRTQYPIVMTSDFLLTIKSSPRPIEVARAVKPAVKLADRRVQEKLEIEKRYWAARGIEWRLITDRDIPKVLAQNLALIQKYRDISDRVNGHAVRLPEIIAYLTESAVNDSDQSLRELSQNCDRSCGLPPGSSLTVIYHLLAVRQWDADLSVPLEPYQPIKSLIVREV